jgi:hypothetical protein
MIITKFSNLRPSLYRISLCINHNCYLYMPSWGPDLVNKLISISISIQIECGRIRRHP